MTCPRLIVAVIGLVLCSIGAHAAPRHGGPPAHIMTANYHKPGDLTGVRQSRLHPSRVVLPRVRNTAHS